MPVNSNIDIQDVIPTYEHFETAYMVAGMTFDNEEDMPDLGSIRIIEQGQFNNNTYCCLGVDVDKLNTVFTKAYIGNAFNVGSGSVCVVADTQRAFIYHITDDTWHEWEYVSDFFNILSGVTDEEARSEIITLNTRVNNIIARVDNIIAHNNDTDGNTELIDIRTGYNSTNYATAGTAVRTQIGSLENKTDNIQVLCDSAVEDGTTRFNSADFENRGLNSRGVRNSVRYQVSTINITTATKNITITPNNGFRVYIYYFNSLDINDDVQSTVSWQTEAYTIPTGKYYKIVIARVTQDTSEIADVDEFVNAVKVATNLSATMELCSTLNTSVQSISSTVTELEGDKQDLTNQIQNIVADGTTRFNSADFDNYDLANEGQRNWKRYRVSSNEITTADSDITITPISGFRCYIHYFDNEDVWQSSSGWQTSSYTIVSGSNYKLLIARVSPEDTSETADVGEFINAVKVSTFLSEVALKSDIVDLYSGYNFALPEYYNTDGYLYQKINAIHLHERAENSPTASYAFNTVTYGFITDMHYPANKLSSIPLLERIKAQTNATHLFYGGDSPRAYGTVQNLIDDNYAVAKLLYQVYGSDYSYIFGNHDYTICTGSTWGKNMETINAVHAIYKKGFAINTGGNYHYWDDTVNKIRHIFIYYPKAADSVFLKWFGTVALAAPDGYGLCFYAHVPFFTIDNVTVLSGMENLRDWICAIANKQSFNTYDYSNTSLYVIYAAFGHVHKDTLTQYNGVNFFSTTCDALYRDDGYDRQAGTTSENAFDVIVINKSTKMVYLTRIGAGNDRSFSYGGV